MKINYDPEVDALYVELRNVPAATNKDIEEGVTIDLDKKGHIIGIEVLDAKKRLKEDLFSLQFTEIPMRKVASA